jgi:hypothetical protein
VKCLLDSVVLHRGLLAKGKGNGLSLWHVALVKWSNTIVSLLLGGPHLSAPRQWFYHKSCLACMLAYRPFAMGGAWQPSWRTSRGGGNGESVQRGC